MKRRSTVLSFRRHQQAIRVKSGSSVSGISIEPGGIQEQTRTLVSDPRKAYSNQMQNSVLPKEYFYCVDGAKVEGPHTGREIAELLAEGVLTKDAHVITTGETEWKVLGQHPDITVIVIAEKEVDDHRSVSQTAGTQTISAEDREEAAEEEEITKTRRRTRHGMLRSIRGSLDRIWEAQREAIIARIRDEDLDVEFEATRKQHKELFSNIQETVLEYWRADGILNNWIRDLTWNDADFALKFKGSSEPEKFEEVMGWLASKNLLQLPAVYCFICGKEYIYVGQAKEIGSRLKQHEQKTFFTRADKIRIIVPQNKRMLNKLERLVILNRQPVENRASGLSKGNPADDCMEYIRREIKELISDF